jgi:hypothetical protein
LWIGALCCAVGVGLIAANVALNFLGLDASYNFGDPAKFEFILVPFWQIGAAIAVLGAICLVSRRWPRSPVRN